MRLLVLLLVNVTVLVTKVYCNTCDYSKCELKCANPDYRSVNECCGDCSKSLCQFEGCVRFGPFGPMWYPDSCTSCYCSDGKPVCINEEDNCPTLNCFGRPIITRSGECCPACDFGIPEDECGTVPVENSSRSLLVNGEECRQQVILNGCDKEAVRKGDQWYACRTKEVQVTDTSAPSSCDDVPIVETLTCETVDTSSLADFSPPSTLPCIPV